MTIRPATPADVAALDAMIPESVRALSRPLYDDAQIESAIRHMFGVDSQLVADGTYLVAETATGAVAGCGGWSRRRALYGGDRMKTGADPLLDPAVDAARIRAFFVHPAHARRGVGTALLRACAEAAHAAGFRRLQLVATLPGERLYAAHGFVAVERDVATMPDGVRVPVVVMQRATRPGVAPT